MGSRTICTAGKTVSSRTTDNDVTESLVNGEQPRVSRACHHFREGSLCRMTTCILPMSTTSRHPWTASTQCAVDTQVLAMPMLIMSCLHQANLHLKCTLNTSIIMGTNLHSYMPEIHRCMPSSNPFMGNIHHKDITNAIHCMTSISYLMEALRHSFTECVDHHTASYRNLTLTFHRKHTTAADICCYKASSSYSKGLTHTLQRMHMMSSRQSACLIPRCTYRTIPHHDSMAAIPTRYLLMLNSTHTPKARRFIIPGIQHKGGPS